MELSARDTLDLIDALEAQITFHENRVYYLSADEGHSIMRDIFIQNHKDTHDRLVNLRDRLYEGDAHV